MIFLFTSAACQHKFPNVYEIFNPFKPDNQIYSIITLCVNWVSFRLVTTCPGLMFSGNSIVWPCQLWRTFRSWVATLRRSACTSRPTQWRKWSETTVCINTVLIIYTVNQTLFCDLLVNYFHNKANSYEYRLKQIQKTPRY